jgi:hypothetical protein
MINVLIPKNNILIISIEDMQKIVTQGTGKAAG